MLSARVTPHRSKRRLLSAESIGNASSKRLSRASALTLRLPNAWNRDASWNSSGLRFILSMFRQRSRSWLRQEPPLRHLTHLQQACWPQRSQKSIQKRFQSFVCRSGNGEVMMTNSDACSPFVVRDYFLETAFELRFQGLLRSAWEHRTWHVIAALPGSGKSLGIADITHQSDSYKDTRRGTYMPILAIRAPKNGGKDLALGMAFCAAFGIVPTMPWYVRRSWLVQAMADAQVECIVIDDAQDLNLAHLAFLKELTDNLAAPPYQRQVSLCLVTAHSGKVIPLKEIFSRPDILWRQFRRRLDTERPFCLVAGHTEEEVRSILEAFETIYRDQLPDLHLLRWTRPIFTWLTHATLDPDGTKRVTMDHLTRLVTAALRRSYEQGASDVDAAALSQTADLMILRRDEIVEIAGVPPDSTFPVEEVG